MKEAGLGESRSRGSGESGGEPWVSAGERHRQELVLNSVDVGAFFKELAVLTAT